MKKILLTAAVALVCGCGMERKLDYVRKDSVSATVSLPDRGDLSESDDLQVQRDTLTIVDIDGTEMMIMKAVRDENGEMVASDVIDAAVVSARFRNVAERGGKVSLEFDIRVPEKMMDSRWQLRFTPSLSIMGENRELDPVIITGSGYRKTQLRGYQQYERFLASIASDSLKFIRSGQLDVFLKRNLPQIYRFRGDTSFVDDNEFASSFGVSGREALEHYRNEILIRKNRKKIGMKGRVFERFVKAPILTEGLRLDTVIHEYTGDFTYRYVQTLATTPSLKRVDLTLKGRIYEQDNPVYTMPESEPLSFYISSLSWFADPAFKYLKEVVSRSVEMTDRCHIDFAVGKSDIRIDLSENEAEISRVESNLLTLLQNEKFDIDSIVISASCSPEGSLYANRQLSQRRSEAVSDYFGKFINRSADSLSSGMSIVADQEWDQERNGKIEFLPRNRAENWDLLDDLVRSDTCLSSSQKESYSLVRSISDPDSRERAMKNEDFYEYVRTSLYPKLRTVEFVFHLHRKGMVKDTIQTTVLDTVYMSGLKALMDRDYDKAVLLLHNYSDLNAAVACCAAGRNATALDILLKMEPSDKVNYLLAVIYSRLGRQRDAVECYLRSCRQNPAYINRGRLDPEISSLIKAYDLETKTNSNTY